MLVCKTNGTIKTVFRGTRPATLAKTFFSDPLDILVAYSFRFSFARSRCAASIIYVIDKIFIKVKSVIYRQEAEENFF